MTERLNLANKTTYRVRIVKILKGSLLSTQLSVHNHWEVHIQNNIVVDGQSKHQSDQTELTISLK